MATGRITEDTSPAIWHYDGKDYTFGYSITMVDGFTLSTFMSLDNAPHYAPAMMRHLMEWFELEQRQWGVPHMIVLAVTQYASDLVKR